MTHKMPQIKYSWQFQLVTPVQVRHSWQVQGKYEYKSHNTNAEVTTQSQKPQWKHNNNGCLQWYNQLIFTHFLQLSVCSCVVAFASVFSVDVFKKRPTQYKGISVITKKNSAFDDVTLSVSRAHRFNCSNELWKENLVEECTWRELLLP